MLNYFTLNTTIETVCFIVACICLIKDKSLVWRSMVIFLLITCIAEFMGIHVKRLYLADRIHIHPNGWVYNILMVFQAGFMSLMFQYFLRTHKYARYAIGVGFIALLLLHLYEIFNNSIYSYDELTNTIMSVLVVFYSFYFYYSLLNDDTYIGLNKSAEFWWVVGILFFYFATTVSNLFYDRLSSIVIKSRHNLMYLRYLNNALNIILYSCWSYSFVCRKWLTKTSEA